MAAAAIFLAHLASDYLANTALQVTVGLPMPGCPTTSSIRPA